MFVAKQQERRGQKHAPLSSIQALRAFAALYVFTFHSQVRFVTPWPGLNEQITRLTLLGWVGVDLFFVISGFIIAWACVLSRPRPETIKEFAIKRFFRVVPLYWFATVLAGLLLQKFFMRTDWTTFIKSLAFYPNMTEVAPWLGYPPIYPGWTLNYEFFFYLLFAVCLLAGRWALVLAPTALLACVIGPQWYAGGAINLIPDQAPVHEFGYAALATNPILLEFGMGCVLAALFHMLQGRVPKTIAAAAFGISLAWYAYCIFAVPLVRHGPISIGLPSAALILGLLLAEDAGLVKPPKWAVELGTISYSIYLFQPFVVKPFIGLNRYAANSLVVAVFACILETALLIWIARKAYQKLESPMISVARRLLTKQGSQTTTSSAPIAVTADRPSLT